MTARKPKDAHKKVGRPSSYKPEYCQQLIEHMSKGFSYETFDAASDVTLRAWEDEYPEFLAAKNEGMKACRKWWETVGAKGLLGQIKGFIPSIWIFNMKNRFKWHDQINITEPAKEMAKADEIKKLSERLQSIKNVINE